MREDLFKKGRAEYQAGRYKNAARQFLAAIRTDKENAAWKSLGLTHAYQNDSVAWYALGRCFMHLKQTEKAVQCFRNAVQISPGCTKCQRALREATRIPLREKITRLSRKINRFMEVRIWRPAREAFHSFRLPSREVELSNGGRKKTFFSFLKKTSDANRVHPSRGGETNPHVQTGYPSSGKAIHHPSGGREYSRQNFQDKLMRESEADIARALAERRRQSEEEEIEELLALDII
jgi:tetratricopeptide (TPR) repeat protein